MHSLAHKVQQFPQQPGIYLMKDAKGVVLYIGKAANLKKRVLSYFQKGRQERYQIAFLMRRVADIEIIVTENEKEALLLENSLIKQHQPRYNLFLKDDKSYPSLKINLSHAAPGLFITRKVVKDGSEYFGPYTSAFGLRQTVDTLTRFFRLRTCSDNEFANRSRPCLKYDIGRCSAPCVGKVTKEAYQKQTEQVLLFLKGKGRLLLQPLKEEMERYSAAEQFEEAALIRDLMAHIQETLEKQNVIRYKNDNYDALGWYETENKVAISVLGIRQGRLMEHKHVLFAGPVVNRNELLASFLIQYYGKLKDPPPEIVISPSFNLEPQVSAILGVKISSCKTGTVSQGTASRGKKSRMQKMAEQNAKAKLHAESTKGEEIETLLLHLQGKLGLAIFPHTIECVDISNIQGRNAVGVIIAFTDGRPDKERYRRFKIRGEETPNDYRMMFEVLERRFKRALNPEEKNAVKWSLPDLLLVDGGKGQLAVALKVLADLGLHNVPVVAIAKGKKEADKIYLPGRKNPANLKPGSRELLYLMRIRDEAHRCAITYHRQKRSTSIF